MIKTLKRSGIMENKWKLTILKIANVLGFGIVIIMNILANLLPINGKTTGELSDLYPNLFVPAGFTFSIWGVIYLFLFLYTIYQTGLINKHTSNEAEKLQGIRGLYIVSCVANASWILCWHYERILLSVLVMLVLLITLIMIHLKSRTEIEFDFKRKVLFLAPFSIYLGWITVATIANVTALLVDIKWNGWGISQEVWTCVVILAAIGITLLFQKKYKDILYSLVILWAILGILIKHVTEYNFQYGIIIGTVCVGLVVILLGMAIIVIRRKNEKSVAK
jgi:hypothetical protein